MSTESLPPASRTNLNAWLAEYKQANCELLQNNREFARWLEEEYVPLAGGWQY